MKVMKWIFLCELYPYRMSFLVQILNDWHQKQSFNLQNQHQDKQTSYGIEYIHNAMSTREYTENFYDLDIAQFYFEQVEKYIYAIAGAEKLLRLDSDAELFAVLLCTPMKDINSTESFSISCADVLGMIATKPSTASKASNSVNCRSSFSLLAYSFNLNVSMGKQIGIELQEIVTGYEMVKHKSTTDGPRNASIYSHEDNHGYSNMLRGDGFILQKKRDLIYGVVPDEKKPLLVGVDMRNYASIHN
jgi:hypothetical protein